MSRLGFDGVCQPMCAQARLTTQQYWQALRGPAWHERRLRRAQFHNAMGYLDPPLVAGPLLAQQACDGRGFRHFALRCARQLCARCCVDCGVCQWHALNGCA